MSYYVYRFFNKENEVIYVGRTNNLKTRMNQHFNAKDKATIERNKLVEKIDYIEMNSKNHSCMYEIQMIDYYKPKYNKDYLEEEVNPILIEFENLQFSILDKKHFSKLKNKENNKVNSAVLKDLRKMDKIYVNYYMDKYKFTESESYIILKMLECGYGQGFTIESICSKKDGITLVMAQSVIEKISKINKINSQMIEFNGAEKTYYFLDESFIYEKFEL